MVKVLLALVTMLATVPESLAAGREVPVADAAIHRDIDVPGDLQQSP